MGRRDCDYLSTRIRLGAAGTAMHAQRIINGWMHLVFFGYSIFMSWSQSHSLECCVRGDQLFFSTTLLYEADAQTTYHRCLM
jgi:hypothetical protein